MLKMVYECISCRNSGELINPDNDAMNRTCPKCHKSVSFWCGMSLDDFLLSLSDMTAKEMSNLQTAINISAAYFYDNL